MRISDWSSDVCSSDLLEALTPGFVFRPSPQGSPIFQIRGVGFFEEAIGISPTVTTYVDQAPLPFSVMAQGAMFDVERVEVLKGPQGTLFGQNRSEEHTSELQSLMRISYAVFCLKTKKTNTHTRYKTYQLL